MYFKANSWNESLPIVGAMFRWHCDQRDVHWLKHKSKTIQFHYVRIFITRECISLIEVICHKGGFDPMVKFQVGRTYAPFLLYGPKHMVPANYIVGLGVWSPTNHLLFVSHGWMVEKKWSGIQIQHVKARGLLPSGLGPSPRARSKKKGVGVKAGELRIAQYWAGSIFCYRPSICHRLQFPVWVSTGDDDLCRTFCIV